MRRCLSEGWYISQSKWDIGETYWWRRGNNPQASYTSSCFRESLQWLLPVPWLSSKGKFLDAIESCHQEFVTIISSVRESLALWLESILENDVFKAISVILDSESYQFLESDIVFDEVKVVVDYSSHLCWQITVT